MTMLAFAPILQQQSPAAGGPAATSLALSTEASVNITAENGDYLLIEGDGLLAENGTDLVTTENDRFLVLDGA